jgi:hypothetical protein
VDFIVAFIKTFIVGERVDRPSRTQKRDPAQVTGMPAEERRP